MSFLCLQPLRRVLKGGIHSDSQSDQAIPGMNSILWSQGKPMEIKPKARGRWSGPDSAELCSPGWGPVQLWARISKEPPKSSVSRSCCEVPKLLHPPCSLNSLSRLAHPLTVSLLPPQQGFPWPEARLCLTFQVCPESPWRHWSVWHLSGTRLKGLCSHTPSL